MLFHAIKNASLICFIINYWLYGTFEEWKHGDTVWCFTSQILMGFWYWATFKINGRRLSYLKTVVGDCRTRYTYILK